MISKVLQLSGKWLLALARTVVVLTVGLAVVLAVAWWLAPEEVKNRPDGGVSETTSNGARTIWTCSMHPQIRLSQPGKCPICGMALISASAIAEETSGVTLGEEGRRVARVTTEQVQRSDVLATIETVGKFDLDERRLAKLTAWLDGRIERVHVPYVGTIVHVGDPLVDLYAPELPVVFEELRAASHLDAAFRESLRRRFYRFGIAEDQLRELEDAKIPSPRVTIRAPIGGVVMSRTAEPGSFVREGDLLVQLGALDPIAADVEIFERDLALVGPGTQVAITVDALPGQSFEGEVEYLKPFLTKETRTVRARVLLRNPDGLARPEMWFRARFLIPVNSDGSLIAARRANLGEPAPLPIIAPEIPALRTALSPTSRPASRPSEPPLLIPVSAVLDLGKRRIVYVERPVPESRSSAFVGLGHYDPVEVILGPRIGDRFVVISGLKDGDRVVTRGAFLLDSQTQIEGKPSLVFAAGAGADAAIHAGHSGHEAHRAAPGVAPR